MSHGNGLKALLRTPPGKDGRFGSQAPFHDLVPAEQVPALGIEVFFHPPDQVALQLLHVFQPFGFHPCPAARAVMPGLLAGFIPADMDQPGGENLDDLIQHRLEQLECLLGPRTDIRGIDRLSVRSQAGDLRIGTQDLGTVPRHFNFRNHLDMAFGGIRDNLAELVLGQVTAIGSGRSFFQIMTAAAVPLRPRIPVPPGAQRGQARITVDLDPPAGTVRQVHVKDIHLQQGHSIQLFQDEVLAAEMPGQVHHESPVREPGPVHDRTARQGAVLGEKTQLRKGLAGAVGTLLGQGPDINAPEADRQQVSLLCGKGRKVLDNFLQGFVAHPDPDILPVFAGNIMAGGRFIGDRLGNQHTRPCGQNQRQKER